MFIPGCDELKEVVSLPRRKFGVSYLIDDQDTGSGVSTESLSHQAWIGCGVECFGQMGKRREQSRVPCCKRFDGQSNREMRFSCSRRSKKNDIGRRLNKRKICQFPKQALGKTGLKGKLK